MFLDHVITPSRVVGGELVDMIAVALQGAELDEAMCWALREWGSASQAAVVLDIDRRTVAAHRDQCGAHTPATLVRGRS